MHAPSSASASGERRTKKPCCCGCLSRKGCVLLLITCALCSVVCTIVGINTIGKAIAADQIQQATISFRLIDVGTLNGTNVIYPRIIGSVKKPSPFDATFYPAAAKIKVAGQANTELVEIGTVWLPELHVSGGMDLDLDMKVKLQIDFPDVFGEAGQHFVADDKSSWAIEASVNVFCWFLFVPISINGVPFAKTVTLKGMSGFSQSRNPIKMQSMVGTHGLPGVLHVGVVVTLFNPSYMAAHIASGMHLNVTQREKIFGVATLRDIHIQPGRNSIFVQFGLQNNPTNQDAVEEFILGYLKAENQPVALLGSESSTADPLLKKVLGGLAMRFNFQAPSTQFIQGLEATAGLGLNAIASIYNPLLANIIFGSLAIEVNEGSTRGENVFTLDTDKSKTSIPGQILRANQTSDLHIKLSLWDAHLTDFRQLTRLIGDAHRGRVLVGVKGPVTITIAPAFQLKIHYSAENVTCLLKCPVFCKPSDTIHN